MRGSVVLSCFRVLAATVTTILCFAANDLHAQDQTTSNPFIFGRVLAGDGVIFFNLPPGQVGTDPQLDFYDKCFFTAKIGSMYFTNNNVIAPLPSGANRLHTPDTLKKIKDTVHAEWNNKNGVDIIQDIWPVAFTKSGQIVIRWSFRSRDTSQLTPVQCQWLNDMDISDPRDHRPNNANDAPWFFHKYGYYNQNQQYPNTTITPNLPIPPFFTCFLYNLPGPNQNPGLASLGYLDYPPLGTTKPFRITMADWYTLASTIFGPNPAIKMGQQLGPDDAILIEFNPTVIGGKNRTVVGGVTSFGTSEIPQCVGNMFGLLFYPHEVPFDKKTHSYKPTPLNIELYACNYNQTNAAFNSQFSLTVGPHLMLCDSLNTTTFSNGQTIPVPASTINVGGVLVLDWYAKADPVLLCTGDFISSLKIRGVSSLENSFSDEFGVLGDTCEHDIAIGCAETDSLPPLVSEVRSGPSADSITLIVSDDRTSPIIDRGLSSISWQAESGTDASNFKIMLLDSVKPCFNDRSKHRIVMTQLDSTVGGCFDFLFIDCLNNEGDTAICFPAHGFVYPDTLGPRIIVVLKSGSADGSDCNERFDSLLVLDNRVHDTGIDTVIPIPGTTLKNMTVTLAPYKHGAPNVPIAIRVIDSLKDGLACIRVIDAAEPSNHFDTCFSYCSGVLSVDGAAAHRLPTLEQNHPNPFSKLTTFDYSIPEYSMVRMYVYDILGKEVLRLIDKPLEPGSYSATIDGRALTEGTYIVRLEAGGSVVSRTIVVSK